ncbi:GtrA family protein [Cohnella lupini]|uniref:Putative flippase GtrA n=1 Tax=Cohnella lupini TaxID=1294267 RepID=A0A3D9I7H3_9BACL|nr:GtrA family protein [Cohnella lupini]RED57630.1 putative flippase GtrA [Cohnella lupini]
MIIQTYKVKEVVKFLLIGLANTGITYVVYLGLLLICPYSISYVLSFILGIFISFVLNSLLVFNSNMSIKKLIQFPLVYIIQLLIGWVLMYMFVEKIGLNKEISPLVISAVTIPITFIISKYILTGRLEGKREKE